MTVENKTSGSCIADARDIVKSLGGPTQARIWWVEINTNDPTEETIGHAFVIPNSFLDSQPALNPHPSSPDSCVKYPQLVGEIKQRGQDRTPYFLSLPESMV